LQGRRAPGLAARHGASWGLALHDFWFGAELDPSAFGVDLKMFVHHVLRIGLWLVVASFAYAQYEAHGRLSDRMCVFQLFWWAYLATDAYYEDVMLSSFEILAERFGFLMVWSHLVLGMLYSIGGWYLIDLQQPMSVATVVGISVLYGLGAVISRGANLQKHRFKEDPNAIIWGKRAQALGGQLLISGWWSIGRKINYAGELAVYLAISLTTGLHSVVPYLLPMGLFVVLAQRAARDERRCRDKYGELWSAYCARVPFRMVPFMY
jgi:delta14-sterol reductase